MGEEYDEFDLNGPNVETLETFTAGTIQAYDDNGFHKFHGVFLNGRWYMCSAYDFSRLTIILQNHVATNMTQEEIDEDRPDDSGG